LLPGLTSRLLLIVLKFFSTAIVSWLIFMV
jgi:hypothetical protein